MKLFAVVSPTLIFLVDTDILYCFYVLHVLYENYDYYMYYMYITVYCILLCNFFWGEMGGYLLEVEDITQ